jgi:hypothetical protein
METIILDTLAKLDRHGHGLFGWCSDCGSPSRYWEDVRARRAPKPAPGVGQPESKFCSFSVATKAAIASELTQRVTRATPPSSLSAEDAIIRCGDLSVRMYEATHAFSRLFPAPRLALATGFQ